MNNNNVTLGGFSLLAENEVLELAGVSAAVAAAGEHEHRWKICVFSLLIIYNDFLSLFGSY